jgi:hypothetical protein
MVRPISLRLTQRQNALIAEARSKLDPAQKARLQQAHNAAVMQQARHIVERAKEEKRLRYGAENAARRALLVVEQAYDRTYGLRSPSSLAWRSSSSCWRHSSLISALVITGVPLSRSSSIRARPMRQRA